MIRKMHHAAWRCRDSEETRRFYEDFLGMPLAAAHGFEAETDGRPVRGMHTFFALEDGSFLAFFDLAGEPFDAKRWSDFDMHLACEVDAAAIDETIARARARGIEVRGPANHLFVRSIYLRDPNGYVVELTAKTAEHDQVLAQAKAAARLALSEWQASKATRTAPAALEPAQ